MPPDLLLNSGFNSSTVQTATSAFPYYGLGPVDFSQLNFVKTKQVDYYYDTIGSSSQEYLVSTVTQTYDPTSAILVIGGAMFVFGLVLWGIIKIIRRMGK